MTVNFDFLLAGCNTRCKHCYVHGEPGPRMATEDALSCIERLDEVAALLPGEVAFTLDHEPMNHPDIVLILRTASRTRHIQNYHHGMTTGLALMAREDREAVAQSYLECGYREFGVTIHGAPEHHDGIVRRRGAFDASVRAARFLREMGASVQVSLMLNRHFAEDAEAIDRLLDELRPDDVYFAMPIFTPHRDMLDFEPHRATLETLEAIRPHLPRWGQDAEMIFAEAERNCPPGAAERLRALDLRELWTQPQEELYLSLHPDCKLYVGNSGAETRLLGDLRELSPESVAETLSALPGNRDYGAFYDADILPEREAVLRALSALPQSLVNGDFPSTLYRALLELGTPTRILDFAR